MMAMIGVFSLIATTLQNSGFPTALANMKEPRDEDYNSVFWFNIIVGFSSVLRLLLPITMNRDLSLFAVMPFSVS